MIFAFDNTAIATIAVAVIGLIAGVLAKKQDNIVKRQDGKLLELKATQDNSNVQTEFGFKVINRSIEITEEQNKQLRLDLIDAEIKIDKIQKSLDSSRKDNHILREEMRASDAKCKEDLRLMSEKIRILEEKQSNDQA